MTRSPSSHGTTIFVVMRHVSYESGDLVSVHSTREKATAAIGRYVPNAVRNVDGEWESRDGAEYHEIEELIVK